MALTLEQVEARLDVLEGANRRLKERVDRQVNPFEDIAVQLSLENGHTVSARTRRFPIPVLGGSYDFANQAWADAVTDDIVLSTPIPADWVEDTDLTLSVQLYGDASGTAIMDSFIALNKDGDTQSLSNQENAANIDQTLTVDIVVSIDRTVTGTNVETGDIILWRIRRVGGDGSDTVGDKVIFNGAWLEYTAFF